MPWHAALVARWRAHVLRIHERASSSCMDGTVWRDAKEGNQLVTSCAVIYYFWGDGQTALNIEQVVVVCVLPGVGILHYRWLNGLRLPCESVRHG